MAYEKALSLITGGGFTPAELVFDRDKYIVKATPDTIESVFVAVGNPTASETMAIYRIRSGADEQGAYAFFMGIPDGTTTTVKTFEYDETAGGYVYERGGDLG